MHKYYTADVCRARGYRLHSLEISGTVPDLFHFVPGSRRPYCLGSRPDVYKLILNVVTTVVT